jgi:apolipoprotein D and lipocalin family protein
MRLLFILFCVVLSSCSRGPAVASLRTVEQVDLQRFQGDWYMIAHIPYILERGKVGTLDRYKLRPDGKLDVSYLFRKGQLSAPLEQWKGTATVVNKQSNAEWRVQFLWPFSVPYLLIDLDTDYGWAAIGYPDRSLGWVMSRTPNLDPKIYQGILQRMKAQGYDVSQLRLIPQLKNSGAVSAQRMDR